MAPRIVDKEQKRKEIAIASFELIHNVGIKKMTVAQVAIAAGIGKGTVYEYFESKDDVVFEIISIYIQEYHDNFLKTIEDVKTTKEKVFHFFKFVVDDSLENLKQFNSYKEYLSIVLSDDNHAMKKFNTTCNNFFNNQLKKFIKEGIEKKELIPEAINFIEGLLVFEKGLALSKMSEKIFDAKRVGESFLNNLWELIEVKK